MSNETKQTAVDSIIEFCEKQMDKDSSIHKGVYLSIIKFCQEQITKESEISWKTTLVTTKPIYWTNNKQQTAVEDLETQIEKLRFQGVTEWQCGYQKALNEVLFLLKQAKEMEKQKMIEFARNYMLYIHKEGIITIETFYNETYGGNK